MAETKPVQSLLRGIDILQLLAEADDGLRLQDLSEKMGLKVPTTHNLLKTLIQRGLVEKRSGGSYRLGSAMRHMADRVFESRQMRAAETVCLELSASPLRPLINYCELSAGQIVVRLRIAPEAPLVVQRPVGRHHNPYTTAVGLAVWAFGTEDMIISLREAYPFEEHGLGLWQSRAAFEEYLGNIHREGVAVFPSDKSEMFKVAAMIPLSGDHTILGIGVPLSRAESPKIQAQIAAELRAAAARLHELTTSDPAPAPAAGSDRARTPRLQPQTVS